MAGNRNDFLANMIAQKKAEQEAREAAWKAQVAAKKAEEARLLAEYQQKCLVEFKSLVKSPEFVVDNIQQGTELLTKARKLFFGCLPIMTEADTAEHKLLTDAEEKYAKMVEEAEAEQARILKEAKLAKARQLSIENRQRDLEASAAKAIRNQNEAIANKILAGYDEQQAHCFQTVRALLPHLNNYHAKDDNTRITARKVRRKLETQIFWVGANLYSHIKDDLSVFLYTFGNIAHKMIHSGITLDKIKVELSKKYYRMDKYFIIPDGGVIDLYENKDGIQLKVFTIGEYLEPEYYCFERGDRRLGTKDCYVKTLLTRKQLDDNAKLVAEEAEETAEENPFDSFYAELSAEEVPNAEKDFDINKIFSCLEDDSNSDSDRGNQG